MLAVEVICQKRGEGFCFANAFLTRRDRSFCGGYSRVCWERMRGVWKRCCRYHCGMLVSSRSGDRPDPLDPKAMTHARSGHRDVPKTGDAI